MTKGGRPRVIGVTFSDIAARALGAPRRDWHFNPADGRWSPAIAERYRTDGVSTPVVATVFGLSILRSHVASPMAPTSS